MNFVHDFSRNRTTANSRVTYEPPHWKLQTELECSSSSKWATLTVALEALIGRITRFCKKQMHERRCPVESWLKHFPKGNKNNCAHSPNVHCCSSAYETITCAHSGLLVPTNANKRTVCILTVDSCFGGDTLHDFILKSMHRDVTCHYRINESQIVLLVQSLRCMSYGHVKSLRDYALFCCQMIIIIARSWSGLVGDKVLIRALGSSCFADHLTTSRLQGAGANKCSGPQPWKNTEWCGLENCEFKLSIRVHVSLSSRFVYMHIR